MSAYIGTRAAANWTGQIGSGGVADDTVTTVPLQSATGLTNGKVYIATVDRVDSNGTATPSAKEVVKGTLSGSNLINCTRGVEGTAQSHNAGAVVEILFTATHHNELVEGLEVEHGSDGTHDFSSSNVDFQGISLAGGTTMTAVLDEDDMASDSATSLATQQSIKAYVGGKIIDEDDMASDSATKVPTQQSVKAYVDAASSAPTVIYNGQRTGGDVTVTSITSSYGDIGNEFTTTQTTSGGLIVVNVWVTVAPNVGTYPQTTRLNLRVDSTDYLLCQLGQTGNINLGTGGQIMISGLSAGSHTFKVQVGHNGNGSVIVKADGTTGARMQIIEYPS